MLTLHDSTCFRSLRSALIHLCSSHACLPQIALDEEWSAKAATNPDLVEAGISSPPVIMGDWLIMTSSSQPQPGPLNMTAVRWDDPTVGFSIAPFAGEPCRPKAELTA